MTFYVQVRPGKKYDFETLPGSFSSESDASNFRYQYLRDWSANNKGKSYRERPEDRIVNNPALTTPFIDCQEKVVEVGDYIAVACSYGNGSIMRHGRVIKFTRGEKFALEEDGEVGSLMNFDSTRVFKVD